MSWSVSASKCNPPNAEGLLRESFASAYKEPSAEVVEQFESALMAFAGILPSVQPDAGGFVNVSLTGHANKEHRPDPAWANDMVSISVQQVSA